MKDWKNWIIPVGSIGLMAIYYGLGPIPLFCAVGGLMAGGIIVMANDRP